MKHRVESIPNTSFKIRNGDLSKYIRNTSSTPLSRKLFFCSNVN